MHTGTYNCLVILHKVFHLKFLENAESNSNIYRDLFSALLFMPQAPLVGRSTTEGGSHIAEAPLIYFHTDKEISSSVLQ